MDVLRIDFNMEPLPFWRHNDAKDRQGMNEIRHVMGLYKMWDEILAKYPNIFIDNCASGGRRIDLETNTRAIPVWRSDYNDNNSMRGDPLADQGMTMGLATFAPINTGPAWRSDPYYWRCASSTSPIGYWDLRPKNYSIDECRQAIAESRKLRQYALGDYWQLTENNLDLRQWAGWQYHRPEQDDGYAVFFRRRDCPFIMMEVSLRGVAADAKYRVRLYYSYKLDKEQTLTGKQLRNWAVSIPKRRGSLLVRYERVK
jgi:alpha-galactosidase